MAMYRCYSDTSEPYDLLDICKKKIESGTPTALTVYQSRMTNVTGGYVTDSDYVYLYTKGINNFMSLSTGSVTSAALFAPIPSMYSGSQASDDYCVVAYNKTKDYIIPCRISNNTSVGGGVLSFIKPSSKTVSVGDEIIFYGMYLKQ